MRQLFESHTFTGMQRDLSVSKHPAQFLYDGHNIRLTSREDNTLLAITNEKGTLNTDVTVEGTYLGHALLNQYLIIFSKDTEGGKDRITRINLADTSQSATTVLCNEDLGFQLDHPIEAIVSFENDNIQKVYWTDNLNPPRLINISPSNDEKISSYTSTSFDFIPELDLKETVTVKKLLGASGEFAPGVIQYALTYYNKYGQESNIFWTTSLFYISYSDRGAAPDDKVANAFEITVSNVDTKFDFLRIYSIQRTSLDAVPFVKRIQDIDLHGIENDTVTFIDTGLTGNNIDPTELLYKGGETIRAKTIEQKDNTLFLGNISLDRTSLDLHNEEGSIKNAISITTERRALKPHSVTSGSYKYSNQLSHTDNDGNAVPCCYFKRGDVYRLGVQFQHKNGKWSAPIRLEDNGDDFEMDKGPTENSSTSVLNLPIFKGTLEGKEVGTLWKAGFRKVRAVVVYPDAQDRNILCQGVINPTLTTVAQEGANIKAQSSWFFRPICSSYIDGVRVSPKPFNVGGTGGYTDIYLDYAGRNTSQDTPDEHDGPYNPEKLRAVEIQGYYDRSTQFFLRPSYMTFHSSDVEFDDYLSVVDFNTDLRYRQVGNVLFTATLSDIDIQTETPTISSGGSGFVHRPLFSNSSHGIVSGLFYDDFLVDESDSGKKLSSYNQMGASSKWLIYPWQKKGSLNNDINRPADLGIASSVLKKKVMSNLRYADTTWLGQVPGLSTFDYSPQLFSSDHVSLLKIDTGFYLGNVDTALIPDKGDGIYFAWSGTITPTAGGYIFDPSNDGTSFDSNRWLKTFSYNENDSDHAGVYVWDSQSGKWGRIDTNIGDDIVDLGIKKEMVRMRYKSSPHLVLSIGAGNISYEEGCLPVLEIVRPSVINRFGGDTKDALKENIWVPCGDPVSLNDKKTDVKFYYSWGDTYYQRYDCLKTYAFSRDDINQVVEIGSFMLETHTNIDGRYDRNRGQLNNLNMDPTNFNLLNPVYSQKNNFFTYRILDNDYYTLQKFPNQITWTKEKQSGADTDLWANITLASTYDLDGSKGSITSLNLWKDNIFCFQNKGVSNILFNSRVQIPTSDGIPIEISNNYKVDGCRYIGDGIGCNSARLVKETPSGIYFMDSVSNHLFQIGEVLTDLAQSHNFSSVFKSDEGLFDKILYDDVNKDLYLVNNNTALCYSEVLGQFTSFMDYDSISLVESYDRNVYTYRDGLYQMFADDYNQFFDHYKPWYFTFISNAADQNLQDLDKIFSNIDYRMDVLSGGKYQHTESLDYIRVTNEYQDTDVVALSSQRNVIHTWNQTRNGNRKKKFRVWRVQIPRDKTHRNDRIRNTWCKITLGRNTLNDSTKAVLHDLNVIYYI